MSGNVSDNSFDYLKMWKKLVYNSTYGTQTGTLNQPITNTFKMNFNDQPKIYYRDYFKNFDISDLPKKHRTVVKMIFSKLDETTPKIMKIKLNAVNDFTFIKKILKNLTIHNENSKGEIVNITFFNCNEIIEKLFGGDYIGSTVNDPFIFAKHYLVAKPINMCVFIYTSDIPGEVVDFKRLANYANNVFGKSVLLLELKDV